MPCAKKFCKICNKGISKLANFKMHIALHHFSKIHCEIPNCSYKTGFKARYKKHLQETHRKLGEKLIEKLVGDLEKLKPDFELLKYHWIIFKCYNYKILNIIRWNKFNKLNTNKILRGWSHFIENSIKIRIKVPQNNNLHQFQNKNKKWKSKKKILRNGEKWKKQSYLILF